MPTSKHVSYSFLRPTLVLAALLAFGACTEERRTYSTPDAERPDSTETPPPDAGAGPEAFVKHGDDGLVSCATYCAGAEWGRVGSCLGTAALSFPCDQAMGLLTNGVEQRCTCDAGGTFIKDGDNGTASCDVFCGGSQWGKVGSCVDSELQTNASATIAGQAVAYDADCSVTPGLIRNGAELTCICAAD